MLRIDDEMLKKCPFCGGDATTTRIGNDHTKSRKIRVRCTNCGTQQTTGAIHHGFAWLEDEAAKKWDRRVSVVALEDKILDIISEFGDDPVQCLQIICEDIQLRQHYRAQRAPDPNAPRVEEPT